MREIGKRFAYRPVEKDIFEDVYFRDEYHIRELIGRGVEYVVDVGAHIGSFTVAVMDLLDPTSVIAIEPHPRNQQLLRFNISGCDRPERVRVSPTAVHLLDFNEVRLTDKTDINTGGSTVRGIQRGEPGREDEDKSISVPSSYLPYLLNDAEFPRVDLLKLDCEGGEVPALQSLHECGWLDEVRWIRGEFHSSREQVQELLETTHVVRFYDDVGGLGKFIAHRRP